jgi:uncharacterized protein YkwD
MFRSIFSGIAIVLALLSTAEAGHRNRSRCQLATPVASCSTYAQTTTVVATQSQSVSVATADQSSLIAWLNAHRARYGVGPVAFDPNLVNDAAASNAAMRARGFGHHMQYAPNQKNVGMGPLQTVTVMWTQSPAHNAWLLRARVVGFHYDGYYATMSAY